MNPYQAYMAMVKASAVAEFGGDRPSGDANDSMEMAFQRQALENAYKKDPNVDIIRSYAFTPAAEHPHEAPIPKFKGFHEDGHRLSYHAWNHLGYQMTGKHAPGYDVLSFHELHEKRKLDAAREALMRQHVASSASLPLSRKPTRHMGEAAMRAIGDFLKRK